MSANLSIYIFFQHSSHIFINFGSKFLPNLSETTDFPSLCVEYISVSLFCNQNFIDLLPNLLPLSTHILLGLRPDSSMILQKAFDTFSSFRRITNAYLL